jgi:uncharacterized membrane protein
VVTLEGLAKQQLITIFDAATVSWVEGAKRPKTRQLHNLAGAGALGGAFWGLLFGLLFFVPLLGMAIGAATGALSGALTDVGIDDDFIKKTREQITPGTSALFVMSSGVVVGVQEAFDGQPMELVQTTLTARRPLREVFADSADRRGAAPVATHGHVADDRPGNR